MARFRFVLFSTIVACGGSQPQAKLDDMPQEKLPQPTALTGDPPVPPNPRFQSGPPQDFVDPQIVTPTVTDAQVHDTLDVFTGADDAHFAQLIDKRIAPARVHDGLLDELSKPAAPGGSSFSYAPFIDQSKIVFIARRGGFAAGFVSDLKMPENIIIPPVEWLRAAISFKGLDAATTRAWYVEMSKRIGIKTFEPSKDTSIIATSKFMKAGTFDATAWGPVIRGAQAVTTNDSTNHQGISAADMLVRALGARAPQKSGAAPGSLQL